MPKLTQVGKIAPALCLAWAAVTSPDTAARATLELVIEKVEVAYAADGLPTVMTITGVNFGSAPGAVVFDARAQAVASWTPTRIVVVISGASSPGTYLLEVMKSGSRGEVFHDQANVTLGSVGPEGPRGAAGPPGPAGSGGVSGYDLRSSSSDVSMQPNETVTQTQFCLPGRRVLGGGCRAGERSVNLLHSYPQPDHSWVCKWHNASASAVNLEITVHAICASVAP